MLNMNLDVYTFGSYVALFSLYLIYYSNNGFKICENAYRFRRLWAEMHVNNNGSKLLNYNYFRGEY